MGTRLPFRGLFDFWMELLMRNRTRIEGAFFTLLLFGFIGCEKEQTNPLKVASSNYPKAPANLTALIGDRFIRLQWEDSAPSQGQIEHYNIFRKDTLIVQHMLLDTTSDREYRDQTVRNGMQYSYRVSAVSIDGYEGPVSEAIEVSPGIYGISINQGEAYTNNRSVSLSFIAPAGTRLIKISNDTLLESSAWETFASNRSWELSPGDGAKKVYASFSDELGNQANSPVYDSITLDSRAVITSMQISRNGLVQKAGDNIRVSLNAGEAFGEATFDIGQSLMGNLLYDDGSHGDTESNDGVYVLDYLVPGGLGISNAAITGHFVDALGNVAEPVTASGSVTIANPPSAVRLFEPEVAGNVHDALHLSWTACTEEDFAGYKLFRGSTANIDSTSLLVQIVANVGTTALVDSNLQENSIYYYRIYVTNRQGLSTGSNVVAGRTLANSPPQPVILETPINPTSRSLLLNWSENRERDFASYRIYRSETSVVNAASHQVSLITNKETTTYTDSDLSDNTTYWYRVYVFDFGGLNSGSNIVSAATLIDSPPQPVVLADPAAILPGTLRLSWSQNRDDDFASYQLFRSKTVNIDSTASPIHVLNSQATTSYDDVALEANTRYYYQIFVHDRGGLRAGSNKTTGKTLP